MRTLDGQSVPFIDTGDSDYPTGRVTDVSSPELFDGTPILEKASGMGDPYQAIQEIMRVASVTPNETPERMNNSQFLTALQNLFLSTSLVTPAAVLSFYQGTLLESLGVLTFGSLTETFDDGTNQVRYTLNITTAGNYIVSAAFSNIPVPTSNIYVGSIYCAHNISTGHFVNNSVGNITIQGDFSDASINAITDFTRHFTVTIYKVP